MPAKLPTVAIVEGDKDLARIWRRKLVNTGFTVVGTYAMPAPPGRPFAKSRQMPWCSARRRSPHHCGNGWRWPRWRGELAGKVCFLRGGFHRILSAA